MHQYLQAIITVLALVNPVMCVSIFGKIEGARPRASRLADANKVAFVVMVILLLSAVLGIKALSLFGVSLDAFSVAGGGVLAWIGIGMLKGGSDNQQAQQATDVSQSPVLTPLILFAASPGTITGVITLASNHTRNDFPITALIAVVAVTLIMWLAILLSIRFVSHASNSFVRDTVSRFMGLIVIAMGVQFALNGIKAFFG